MRAVIHYIFDHGLNLVCYGLTIVLVTLILDALHASSLIIITTIIILLIGMFIPFFMDMIRYFLTIHRFKKAFETLSHSEYITQYLARPNDQLGQDIYELLLGCNQNMEATIAALRKNQYELTRYIQLWVHQIKLPLSALNLMANDQNDQMKVELNRLRYDLDMILYYCRVKNANRDFRLTNVDLKTIIHEVLMRQRIALQEYGFTIEPLQQTTLVQSDGKWLAFIIEQIVSNAIKYHDPNKSPLLVFTTSSVDQTTILSIKDNGIGIHPNDLPYIFDPFFTGNNGYTNANSSGMGLSLIKTMCETLSITISIDSDYGRSTTVSLVFTSAASDQKTL